MQSVNGAQFLNITFLLALFTAAAATAVFGSVIIVLTVYMLRYNHINFTLSLTFKFNVNKFNHALF